jgi:hypothetical protein
MIGEAFVHAAANPDVQIVSFPDAPGVSLEVAAEEQFRRLLIDRRALPIEEELRFLRDHWIHAVPFTLKVSRDGTEVATRANDDRRLDLVIGDPPVALAPERGKWPTVQHTHLRPAQQKIVEFAPPDGVTDDARVRRFNGGLTEHARPESGDLLQDETGRAVRRGLQIEGSKHAWRHPAPAHLVAWEACAIEDDDIPSREAKRTRAARAGGSAADD